MNNNLDERILSICCKSGSVCILKKNTYIAGIIEKIKVGFKPDFLLYKITE